MRWIIIGSICAIGPFDTKGAAREYLEREVPQDKQSLFTIMALLPTIPPENGQLPI